MVEVEGSYLRGVVTLDPTEYPFGSMIRALWKGVFEFIRNLVVIAFLKYVALKTGSPYVIFLFELSTFALACYLISFMSISFNLFPFVADPVIRTRLDWITYLVVSFVTFLLARKGIELVVLDIAKAQLG